MPQNDAAITKGSKTKTDLTGKKIASLKQQDKEYNESYRKWRMDHKNDYGLYLADNSDEYTYRNGEGFIVEYPEAAERSALSRVHVTIAAGLILTALITAVLTIGLPILARRHGIFVVHSSANYFSGDTNPAIVCNYLLEIVTRCVPFLYVYLKLKMPLKLLIPTKITNKPLFWESIPAAFITYGICMLFTSGYAAILRCVGICQDASLWMPEGKVPFFFAVLLNTIIVPVLSEIMSRGVFMQMLKQFGDGYALMLTSIISAMFAGNLTTFFSIFTMSLVAGYFMLRSGSIFSAIILHVITSSMTFWLSYLDSGVVSPELSGLIRLLVTFVCLVSGLCFCIIFMRRHSDKISLPMTNMYLSGTEKLMNCVTTPLIIIWISIYIIRIILTVSV
ncbi:MAG: lysostaphin resistance A-like protein [Huintestinicola sp.]